MPTNRPVGVAGLGYYFPERRLTNQDLEALLDTTDEWIRTKIGIRERPIAAAHQAASDLAIPAAEQALRAAGVAAEDVDLIIVAATNHDMLLPATACLVQGALGARRAAAFDVRIACAGAVYALVTGAKFIADGSYETVLVVGAEVHSKMIDYTDRTTAVFFSDGAGAAVLRPTSAGRGLIAWDLGADGANGDAITVPAGGSRLPASHETVEKRLHYVKMEGRRVYDFAVRIFPYTVRRTLARAGLTTSDIDLLIAHQANINIIREGMAALKLSLNRTFNTLEKYGNASAASLFLTMAKAEEAGKLRPGDLLMLVAFGAGLAWGSAALRW